LRSIGVLLIQLGTPDEPTPHAVRRYLREFLSDPRVVEAHRWIWWLVLRTRILPRRSRESAEKYHRIWDDRMGSPLLYYTRRQAQALQQALPAGFAVRFGMRYGNPSLDVAVADLVGRGIDRLIVLPLYPQYSAATTATACDRLFDSLRQQRHMPAIRVVPPFYDDPLYVRAQAELVRQQIRTMPQPPDRMLFSFHGCPVEFVSKGDPYQRQVEATCRQLAGELGLHDDQWILTYQSRFGRQLWLQPYTEDTLRELAQRGLRRVLIALPGFTTDCLETIDEIGREVAESFRHAGGEQLVRCPCLNDSPLWIDTLRHLILREAQGWHDNGASDA
jgi:ferrochelatase